MTALAPAPTVASTLENIIIQGDLSRLTPEQRAAYVLKLCEVLGITPWSRPIQLITLSGKLVPYFTKDGSEQLRKKHQVSITEITTQHLGDVYVVTAKAQDATGRVDAATGAVPIGNLKGEALANALMKAETKAKRRATLSICGLGMLDETELETIKGVVTVPQPVLPLLESAPASAAAPEVTPETDRVPETPVAPPEPAPRVFYQCTILQVQQRDARGVTWAEVSFVGVDEHGEEVSLTLPTLADSRDATLSLAEELCQTNAKLRAIHTAIGPRNKREAISKFERVRQPGEDDVPTADEIFGKDDVGF